MTGLIILVILVPVILFIMLLKLLNRTSDQKEMLESLSRKIDKFNDEVLKLSQNVQQYTPKDIPAKSASSPIITTTSTEIKTVVPSNDNPEKILFFEPIPEVILPDPAPEPALKEKVIAAPPLITQPKAPELGWWAKWVQNNPDIEKFIGENLANKIGIAILVLGISFFVKYAIDKEWINETGRVIIGLACGALLIGIAHFFRNGYRSFSSVLAGGGIAVFYFTIAYAFHQYQLLGQQAAFAIMVCITAFAVLLSILYNRLEIAVIAVIGGFVTPFLVSNGHANFVALFTYLCILNTGLMILSFFKRWPVINSIALIFTVLIYGGWLANTVLHYTNAFPYQSAFFFASFFYVQFLCMNVINNIRLKRSFSRFDFFIVLSTNFLYYSAGMIILHYGGNSSYTGLFTAILGAINFVLARLLFRNNKVDKNFVYLLIGLTLTFISLAAPVQLSGNHITLFWFAESVVLFWLYQQSGLRLIKIGSALIALLALISLSMDWSQAYGSTQIMIPVFFNKGFITSMAAAIALFIYYWLMQKEADSYYLRKLTNEAVRKAFLVTSIFIAYLGGAFEIYHQFQSRIPSLPVYAVYLQFYTFLFVFLVLLVFRKYQHLWKLSIALTLLCFLFYLNYLERNTEVLQGMLSTGQYKAHFIAHWIAVLLLFKLMYDLVASFRTQHMIKKSFETGFTWLATGGIILTLSIEAHHLLVWITYNSAGADNYWENLYAKAGLSILWGVCSFVMMWLGMKYKFRTLRVISLSLFLVTLIKLFGYDILNIPPGGKIAAFILLGVLLLTISFMYQRLKKMIIDDKKEEV